jgi:hypothetical protein
MRSAPPPLVDESALKTPGLIAQSDRRYLNATAHPTAAWALQQLRGSIPSYHDYRFIIHDQDAIFSANLNASLTRLGLKVITTPRQSPQAHSLCERLIGSLRRECPDWNIPLSEQHLRKVLLSWMAAADPTRLLVRVFRATFSVPALATPPTPIRPAGLNRRSPGPEQTTPRIRVHRSCRLSVEDFCRPQVSRAAALAFRVSKANCEPKVELRVFNNRPHIGSVPRPTPQARCTPFHP